MKRERDFYRARGLPCPKDTALAADKPTGDEPEQPDNTDCHRKDEQACIHLLSAATILRLCFYYYFQTADYFLILVEINIDA